MAQREQKQDDMAPLKHKLCRWKDSWSRDSQGGSEVVQVLEEGEESVGGHQVLKRKAIGSPDRNCTPQQQPQGQGQAAPPQPASGLPAPQQEPLKKLRVTAIRRKRSREVLFIEAGKDLVDVVLGFLLLPGWAIVRVLKSESRPTPTMMLSSVGCIDNVYASVRDMDPALLLVDKASLLKGEGSLACLLPALLYLTGAGTGPPNPAPAASPVTGRCTQRCCSSSSSSDNNFVYGCHGRYVAAGVYGPGHQPCPWVAFAPGRVCPCCGSNMTMVYGQVGAAQEKPAVAPSRVVSSNSTPVAPLGSVKEAVTFMVTDVLEIFPSSGVRSMELLNRKRWLTSDLEKVQLELGYLEVRKLMELSMTSESALTETLCSLTH